MERNNLIQYYWRKCREKCLKIICSIKYFVVLLVAAVILFPIPTIEHFIYPLTMCLLADLCNHTWIPECGFENSSIQYRLFIDECDMLEFNCDHNKSFVIRNYSECFVYPPTCPVRRMGNYKFLEDGRKIIYAPTSFPHTHDFRTHEIPNLPPHMLSGKRRYTPEKLKLFYRRFMATSRHPTKRTTKSKRKFKPKTSIKIVVSKGTVLLKKFTVMKDGRMVLKIIKGFPPAVKTDSDFLQK